MSSLSRIRYGLTHIGTAELETLLRFVLGGALRTPLTRDALDAIGCGDLVEDLAIVANLDTNGLRVALVVALAERSRRS